MLEQLNEPPSTNKKKENEGKHAWLNALAHPTVTLRGTIREMQWHHFAFVLTIPAGREEEWETLLSAAIPPKSILCSKQHASLLLMEVEAEVEFLAIDLADQWLQTLAQQADPPFRVGTNAQPAHEIHC